MDPRTGSTTGRLLRGVFAAGAVLLAVVAVVDAWRALLTGGGGDFWSFWAAGRALDRGLDPYDLGVLLLTPTPGDLGRAPFLSPPFLAQAMRPLGLLPFHWAYAVWLAVCLGCLAATVAALLAVARVPSTAANLCCAAVLLVGFAPLMRTIALGQTDLVVVACLAGSWWLRTRGRAFGAGLLASGSLIDPHLAAAFLLYYGYLAVFRGQGRLLSGMVAGLAAAVACSAVHPTYALQWVRVVLPRAQTDVLGMANQVTALRLLHAWLPRVPRVTEAAVAVIDAAALLLACRVWSRRQDAEAEHGMAAAAGLALVTATFAFLPDYLLLVLAAPAAVSLWRQRRNTGPSAPVVLGCLGLTYAAIDAMLLATSHGTAWSVGVGPLVAAAVLAIRAAMAGWEMGSHRRWWVWTVIGWTGGTVAVVVVTATTRNTLCAVAVALAGTAGALAALGAGGRGTGARSWLGHRPSLLDVAEGRGWSDR